jgi:hypothetical protein
MSGCGPIQGRIFVFCWPRPAAVWERQNLGRSRRTRMGVPFPVWQNSHSGLWRSRPFGEVPENLSGQSGRPGLVSFKLRGRIMWRRSFPLLTGEWRWRTPRLSKRTHKSRLDDKQLPHLTLIPFLVPDQAWSAFICDKSCGYSPTRTLCGHPAGVWNGFGGKGDIPCCAVA